MSVTVEGRVGPNVASDGVEEKIRLTRDLAQVAQFAHAKYCESNTRGQLFTVSTPVTGVAPGTALSTTPPLCIWNPLGSGVYVVLTESYLAYISGTLGAGAIVYGTVALQATAPTGGTVLTTVCANVGNAKKSAASAYQGSTVASTPVLLKPAFTMGAALATTPAFQLLAKDPIEGAIVVSPASALVIQGVAAAGTTPLVMFGLSWEEVPV